MAMRSVAGTVDTTAKNPQTPGHQQRRAFPFHRRQILLSWFSQCQPGTTGFLPTHPYGTLAWKQSYGRRNIIEKSNSMLKDKGGLNAGWYRAFGLAAHTIGALALAVAHNLKELKRILSRQKRNGATPEPSHNGTHTASTTEESLSPTLSTRGPP